MKKWGFILVALPWMGYTAPIIHPSTATVFVNNSITITSTDTITCALTAGSTGTLAGCVYTAPKSFAAKNNFDGCNTRPNDDIYNTRIDSLPVDANSATRISNLLGGTSGYVQFEMLGPHNVMFNTTPTTSMVFEDSPNNDSPFPVLPLPYRGVENGAQVVNLFDEDHHVLGVNTNTCNFYEMYGYYAIGSNPNCLTCNSTGGGYFNGNGYYLGDATNGNLAGSDAAGAMIQATELTYHDLKYGINHALRFTMANAYIYSGNLWPAQNFTNECNTFSTCFPYGSRIRLKNNFNVSSYSPTTQKVLNALKQYGAFMDDGGTTMHFSMATDVFTDSVSYNAIQSEIRFGNIADQFNFDQVDESSLMVSSFTGNVNLSNAYMTPDNFAQVIVTKTADSSTATLRIALQPVTVGTDNIPFQANAGSLSVMAGTPQFQIPYWVNGATTTTATCSISPAIGSITSGCLYTAPSTQINYQSSTTLTITPTADPTQAITEPIVIFPSDAIRMNVGGMSIANSPAPPYDALGNYGPDANGNYWWSDPIGNGTPWLIKEDGYYPQTSWPSSTDIGLYYTNWHGATDAAYAMMVPNGYYLLTLGFAIDSPNGNITQIVQSLDSQSVTLASSTTLTGIMGTVNYTPTSGTWLIYVSNNQFYFALRHLYQNLDQLVNNWTLIPTSTPRGTGFYGGVKFQGGDTFK